LIVMLVSQFSDVSDLIYSLLEPIIRTVK
jgi:hypothetical protein